MKHKINLLKRIRKRSPLTQQDVATLLGINQSNLARYESEKRTPTSEILLTYHILFGASLIELLQPLHRNVKRNIINRSQRLIPLHLAIESPKSKLIVSYLDNIVKEIKVNQEVEHE